MEDRLILVRGILEGAFFSPLHILDWPAFCFDQPALLGLEDEEVFDLFIRGAITAETMHPDEAEGRNPLAWLWLVEEPAPVLAHVLADLQKDRPLLFHRTLLSLPAVSQGSLDPKEFELMEDYLARALESQAELTTPALAEFEAVRNRALQAAGQDPAAPDPRVAEWAARVLAAPDMARLWGDRELILWLWGGGGLDKVPPELAPAVMVEVWSAWVGAILGAQPDLELLTRLMPELDLAAPELAGYVPLDRRQKAEIAVTCPFCGLSNRLQLGPRIKELGRCPHLIYVGTSDPAHLWEVLRNFDLGEDFHTLLESYYDSAGDLELFTTLVNDLAEMLQGQGRLAAAPVLCEEHPHALYFLKAYFAGPRAEEETRH
ncbi:MAG: hypothetical protein KQJ78_21785 [Deltaproteobacteria bacterium]|nr:hypothetical protein [Deltaproteobacteria bacterium]